MHIAFRVDKLTKELLIEHLNDNSLNGSNLAARDLLTQYLYNLKIEEYVKELQKEIIELRSQFDEDDLLSEGTVYLDCEEQAIFLFHENGCIPISEHEGISVAMISIPDNALAHSLLDYIETELESFADILFHYTYKNFSSEEKEYFSGLKWVMAQRLSSSLNIKVKMTTEEYFSEGLTLEIHSAFMNRRYEFGGYNDDAFKDQELAAKKIEEISQDFNYWTGEENWFIDRAEIVPYFLDLLPRAFTEFDEQIEEEKNAVC